MEIRLLVVSDGRAGNDAQSLGLAEAIGRRVAAAIDLRRIALKPALDRAPQAVLGPLGLSVLKDPSVVAGAGAQADLIIGAGRRANLITRALKRRTGTPAVAILTPGFRLSDYDLVIAPKHDGLRGDNVAATIGSMNRITPDVVAGAPTPEDWRAPGRRLAVLVGGPSRSARFGDAELARLITDVERFAMAGWRALIVPSRRTPGAVLDTLRGRFADVWTGEAENPYPGVLGVADGVLVTQDSVNMASEAASTGKPVFISGCGRVAAKFLAFHDDLKGRCGVRDASDGPAVWTYAPLAEADRVAGEVCARFGWV